VKSFERFCLGPIELDVKNEILVILGPSGSGKTTLLNIISGIMDIDKGDIWIDGEKISDIPMEKRGVSIVFQEGALFPHMNSKQNIEYASKNEEDVANVVEIFGIENILDRSVLTLSGGEKNRVSLARAIVSNPRVMLLDEPLNSLDYPVKRRLSTDLRKILCLFEMPVIYVTHDRDIAFEMGDRIAIMADGKISQIGTPKEVFENPKTVVAAELMGEANILHVKVVESGLGDTMLEWGPYQIKTTDKKTKNGYKMYACVRPENIVLGMESETENMMQGEVIEKIFKGEKCIVEISIEGIENKIRVSCSPKRDGIKEGEFIKFVIPKNSIRLIEKYN
jgi:molybdate/tungstate transport system ATP-binding protein